MRAWGVGGLPQQLPLPFQACGPQWGSCVKAPGLCGWGQRQDPLRRCSAQEGGGPGLRQLQGSLVSERTPGAD